MIISLVVHRYIVETQYSTVLSLFWINCTTVGLYLAFRLKGKSGIFKTLRVCEYLCFAAKYAYTYVKLNVIVNL